MKSFFKNINLIFTILTVVVFSFALHSQEVRVSAKIDSSKILIGEQTNLHLSVSYRLDKGIIAKIKFPELTDTIRKEIEIVSQSKIDSVIDKDDIYAITLSQSYTITSFDSGYWAIPPIKFIVNNDTNGLFTEPLLLQVNSVAVDTTQAIKDIKPPFEVDYGIIDWIKDNIYLVYVVLGTVALVLLILFLVKKFNKPKPIVAIEKPKIPVHIIALEKLDELKTKGLWQQGKLKLYYSSLTDIVREYIENRFNIQAMEQTTEEILYGFRNVAIDEDSKSKLKQLLILSDLVKFAKENPLSNENEMSLIYAYDFVNGTKREEQIKKQNSV